MPATAGNDLLTLPPTGTNHKAAPPATPALSTVCSNCPYTSSNISSIRTPSATTPTCCASTSPARTSYFLPQQHPPRPSSIEATALTHELETVNSATFNNCSVIRAEGGGVYVAQRSPLFWGRECYGTGKWCLVRVRWWLITSSLLMGCEDYRF